MGFTAIVIVDRSWGIGKDGSQLIYLPPDLKRFKRLTTARTIIYGRKTLATFPHGEPLPGRRNMILSTTLKPVEGAEVYHSVPELLEAAPSTAFVIGGESVYKALFPYTDTVLATKVGVTLPADKRFANLDRRKDWKIHEISKPLEYDGLPFRYITYRRV